MKTWATFFHLRNGAYVGACGDRSIIRLDGRSNRASHKSIAREWGRKHGFDGFRIERGDNLLSLSALTAAIQPIERN